MQRIQVQFLEFTLPKIKILVAKELTLQGRKMIELKTYGVRSKNGPNKCSK